MEPYSYTKLDPDQIRIFDLRLRSSDEAAGTGIEIEGTMRTIDRPKQVPARDSLEAYTALSYAWGVTRTDGSHLRHAIVCDGRRLRVTKSLYGALLRLRVAVQDDPQGNPKPGWRWPYELPLWIDAICIDQTNLIERSEQVAQMYCIYSTANRVLVWLGEPSSGAVGDAQVALLTRSQLAVDSEPRLPHGLRAKFVVQSMLQLPWFERRWVVQEVAAAGDRYTMCLGYLEFEHSTMTYLIDKHDLQDLAGPLSPRLRPMTLLQTLYTFDRSRTSDPHDCIYALQGLATTGDETSHPVDYVQSFEKLYQDVALKAAFGSSLSLGTTAEQVNFDSRGRAREFLRVLCVATAKRRAESMQCARLEDWVPLWTMKNHIQPSLLDMHHTAVTWCVLEHEFLDETLAVLGLPDRVDVEHGYHYLHIKRDPFCSPAMKVRSQDELFRSTKVILHDLVPKMAWYHLGTPHIFWVPWIELPNQPRRNPSAKIFGFTLLPGRTRPTYNGCPVYRLWTCFTMSVEGSDGLVYGDIRNWVEPEVLSRVTLLNGVEFYLE